MKLVYIAGWGHSGTTILDRVLGQLDGFCSVGELRHLWTKSLGFADGHCGCGRLLADCPFWHEVLDRTFDGPPPAAAEIAHLQAREARTRHLPRLWWDGRHGGVDRLGYAQVLDRLYRALADVSGARVLVDSSKYPADAYLASLLDDVDLHVVHCVRDPRAVAYSWSRNRESMNRSGSRDRHSATYSSVRWSAWNATISTMVRRQARRQYTVLRYEDFMGDPKAAVERILAAIGEPAANLPFVSNDAVQLEVTHSAWGNNSRFAVGEVALRADDEWRRSMTHRAQVAATLPALPLLGRYGYPLQP